ncbi:MAG TPA: cytochrome C oxidase subunit IV family protein [Candidatus Paceibacterota bacterium]|nr:cytochrome C oxidase subunit IV family protein [Candidatus Paceibacterota bacterium]
MNRSQGIGTGDYFREIGFWSAGAGLRGYALGFLLSLALTLFAYFLATRHLLSYGAAVGALVALALVQFAVQASFFLHLAEPGVSRERLAIFAGACVVVFILVAGSLWIMFTLNGRMGAMEPSSAQMEHYMESQDGF